MASCGKEFVSLFFYKICNPIRSDEEHVEEAEEVKAEAERKRFEVDLKRTISEAAEELRLKTLVEAELKRTISEEAEELRLKTLVEAERKRSEAELNRLRTTSEEFCLPSDLVVDILSRLAFKDNIRSSAVCKAWGEIAASVRVRDPPRWLMYLDPRHINGVSYGFFDPVEKKKTKAMNLPELSKSSFIVCSKDGWLLMDDYSVNLFFFNPFTRECINLPRNRIKTIETKLAFSCAPTKKGCLVFGITSTMGGREVRISTWHLGATTWVNEDFPNSFPCYVGDTRNVLYSDHDGFFYISMEIALGVFDPSARTWNVVPVQPFRGRKWMTEYKGHIFIVDASFVDPKVFRLNRLESVWEKKGTLDGSSIFVSNGSCAMTSGLTGSMSNIVYIWNRDVNGMRPTKYQCSLKWNRPYKYSLYSRTLCDDPEGYYFEYRTRNQISGVWIEPPHNISISDFPILPAHAINIRQFI